MSFYGEQQSIELPESSQVVINAGSDIKYKKNFANKRDIKLTGEAFLKCNPEAHSPSLQTMEQLQYSERASI